jgi:oligo-1,6-glucosidase
MNEKPKDWFKDAVVYQVYTRSFKDSNGDGIGDFRGILEKLDYIEQLGVDVLWISPFCASPNKDNGYDISDYLAVMTESGTMEDLTELIAECGKRKIEIMMDLVMNHTSDMHPWFIESRSSRTNPKRDYYIWADPRDGGYPNNWESYFTDRAWTWDETTQAYYLHQFYAEQPDLNWNNDEVRRSMIEMIQWWQKKGINAFRLDAIHHIGKPQGLPDAPEPTHPAGRRVIRNTDETHDILKTIARKAFIPSHAMTAGETGGTSSDDARRYVDEDREELSMVFHFEHVYPMTMTAKDLREHFSRWYSVLSPRGWDTVFFCNHDLPRHISIFGNDREYRTECAKSFALMLFTLWGTPFIYQGEELGMTNVRFASLDEYKDESSKRWIQWGIEQGFTEEESTEFFYKKNRDNARTPMQWTHGANAGFTSGTPWIGVNPNYTQINAEAQQNDPDSVLSFYRTLTALRRKNPALRRGSFALFEADDDDIFAYTRSDAETTFLICVNFSSHKAATALPDGSWDLIAGTHLLPEHPHAGRAAFEPWESAIFRLRA